MAKQITKLSEIRFDERNYNLGTEKGKKIIQRSLKELGAGRSILLDKKGKIIAGNKTIESAQDAGFKDEDIILIQTDGTKIVVVQRTDLDLDSKKGRKMALADNAAAKANIEWDYTLLAEDWGIQESAEWGITIPDYSSHNQEVDTAEFEEKCVLFLKYTRMEYELVKAKLAEIAETPELAIWKILNL